MPSTFSVDDVQPVLTRLQGRSLRERFPEMIDAGSHADLFVDTGVAHPLIAAVHLAFSEHRPLCLSPDAVWLTIAQGFAQHVRLNSEKLRERFVRHSGKKVLKVERTHFPVPMEPVIQEFREQLAGELGSGIVRLMLCDFSTTTDVERTASAVILMDTFQPYFDYVLACICGIPSITVLGTEQDWRMIGERVRIIGEYDLIWWTSHLEKIVEHLRRAAAGNPDAAFFRRIYKPEHAYGGEVVTGWIARLYPYVKNAGAFDQRNPLLDIAEENVGRGKNKSKSPRGYEGPGIKTDETMPGLSRAKLNLEVEGQPTRVLDLVAGLAGVTQRDDGSIEARAAWFVEESHGHIGDVIEKLKQNGLPEHPRPPIGALRFLPMECPADIMALYSHFDGGELPFGWSLRPIRKFVSCFHIVEPRFFYAPVHLTVFADLPDGSMLAFAHANLESQSHRGVVHLPQCTFSASSLGCAERDVAWVGDSVAEVLLRAFESSGGDVRIRRAVDLPTLLTFAAYGPIKPYEAPQYGASMGSNDILLKSKSWAARSMP